MKNLQIVQIENFIRQAINKAGYKLVDLSVKGGRRLSLDVVLDKDGGITLDECSSFNRYIVSWLEDGDVDTGNFIVDVCSPGLDRELKSDTSFTWALGKEVQVITREQVEHSNMIRGKLRERNSAGDIIIEIGDGMNISVSSNNINKVKLVPMILRNKKPDQE